MVESPLLSVVIPTRNEEANVGPLLARLGAALGGIDHEILIVDDSDDSTPRAVAAASLADPRIDLLHRQGPDRAGGLSTAVLRGIHSVRGDFVCVMDADLQHPPETIPAMLEAAMAGADVVVASRYTRGGSGQGLDGAGRRVVSRAAGSVARGLFSEARASTDPLSGFFVCRREVIDGIEFRPVGFKILLELLVCVPGLTVRDIPLDFAPRTAGDSKATLRQGLLFLGHIRSLFLDVQGSARRWKFALVGLSGLGILLPLIVLLTGPAGLPLLAAFFPAYLPSLAWNTVLNRTWTFADQRHGVGEGTTVYLERAVLSGGSMFVAYALLLDAHLLPVLAALGGAVVAMAVNAAGNRGAVRRSPRLWSSVATSEGVRAALARVSAEIGADRSYILPPSGVAPAGLPPGTVDRVVSRRRAVLFTETASHRTQRRSNIEVSSTLVAPIVDGDAVAGVLVCERASQHPFGPGDLDAAMNAAPALAGLIGDGAPESAGRSPELRPRTAKA
ncbi:MAG: glycosyltransferase family 2 protein [Candidatus Dormibacteraeota bacterium]|uniref:Glycosyltransferase family 2 protein n=1 Tax=Candidatus Amunia macphersoniae TaxID=3127014 RepID=A0A934NEQ1_9BACT|nr:glycosyltransferase family 2 protein [Candidatus Dormibacteraeota bacterium]